MSLPLKGSVSMGREFSRFLQRSFSFGRSVLRRINRIGFQRETGAISGELKEKNGSRRPESVRAREDNWKGRCEFNLWRARENPSNSTGFLIPAARFRGYSEFIFPRWYRRVGIKSFYRIWIRGNNAHSPALIRLRPAVVVNAALLVASLSLSLRSSPYPPLQCTCPMHCHSCVRTCVPVTNDARVIFVWREIYLDFYSLRKYLSKICGIVRRYIILMMYSL